MKKFFLATLLLATVLLPLNLKAQAQQPNSNPEIEIVNVNIANEKIVADNPDNNLREGNNDPLMSKPKLTPEERNKRIKEADGTGLGITIMSMAIVICSLIVLSLLFLTFGKISQSLHTKKKMEKYGLAHDCDNHEASSGEACAAIAAALHQYFNDRHDVEDTVLTMRKLKRAYSPWSSKLYGLRHLPERNTWHR